jgi:hypothetical protein
MPAVKLVSSLRTCGIYLLTGDAKGGQEDLKVD